jgi:hypothetical protein
MAYVGCSELAGGKSDILPPRQVLLVNTFAPGSAPTGPVMSIPWPWVEHTTFWGHERAAAWLRDVEAKWTRAEEPDPLFGAWIAVGTAQLFPPSTLASGQTSAQSPATSWKELIQQLSALPRSSLRDHWLVAVGLLCTPEMGFTGSTPSSDLVPPDRAEAVQTARAARRPRLPEPVRDLVGPATGRSGATPEKSSGGGSRGSRRATSRTGSQQKP